MLVNKAFVIGDLSWNRIEFPRNNSFAEISGGTGFNVARVFSKYDLYTCILTTLGKDNSAKKIISELTSQGIDTRFIGITDKQETGYHHTIRYSHTLRRTRGNSNANKLGPPKDLSILNKIEQSLLWVSGYALLPVRNRHSTIEIIRKFRSQSLPVILDVLPHRLGLSHISKEYLEALELSSIIVGEIEPLKFIFGWDGEDPKDFAYFLMRKEKSALFSITNDCWLGVSNSGIRKLVSGYSTWHIEKLEGSLDAWVASLIIQTRFSETGNIVEFA